MLSPPMRTQAPLVTVTTADPTTTATPTATPQIPLTGGTGETARGLKSSLTPASIVRTWNANTGPTGAAEHIKTTLQQDGTYTLAEWLAAGSVGLSGGSEVADLAVTEDGDTSASGFIQVIAAAGTVTYGAAGDTNADGSAVDIDGTGDARLVTYQGRFGQLVVDGDGDWDYTLGAGITDLDTALNTADGDTFDTGETLTDRFSVTVNDGTTDAVVQIDITVHGADDAATPANTAPTLVVETDSGDLAGAVTEEMARTPPRGADHC